MTIKSQEESTVKQEKPLLKKRNIPDEINVNEEKKSPLKKRTTPLDEINTDKSVSTILKKKEKSLDNVIDSKKTEDTSVKQKSSLDKMRERIAAQKKLEQDMMTQQTLRNQEKVGMRNKLSALQKDLSQQQEEDEEPVLKTKPNNSFDLKTEALESQNKKLKNDLEKSKQQLQALLSLEFHNMKVLDGNSLTLSNEFVESINSIKEQYEIQKNQEEQTLKDELNALQKELADVKNKNEAAKKASEEAQKIAAQAQKTIDEAKKAIENQESDKVRDFKNEIAILEKDIKAKEKQLVSLQNEKTKLIEAHNLKIKDLKESLESKVKELTKDVKSKEKQIEKLTTSKETLMLDKQEAQKESKRLNNQVESLISKLSDKEQELKERKKIITELNAVKERAESQENISNEELQILKEQLKNIEIEKNSLQKELDDQSTKVEELMLKYQIQLDEKDKETENLRDEIINRDKSVENLGLEIKEKNNQIENLSNKITELPTVEKVIELESKVKELELSVNETERLKKQCESLQSENDDLDSKVKELTVSKQGLEAELVSNNRKLTNIENQYNYLNSKYSEINHIYRLMTIEDFVSELEKRNKMLELLRDEKKDIVKVLKRNGKNTATIEKQIADLDTVINSLNLKQEKEETAVNNEPISNKENVDNTIIEETSVVAEKNIHRIKIEDNIGQKDLAGIKLLHDEISSLEFKLSENKIVEDELREQYSRFVGMRQKLIVDFKVIHKYDDFVRDYDLMKDQINIISLSIENIDSKTDKKCYRAKLAELKSMNSKLLYLEKQIKKLSKNKHVGEYNKLINKIHEFEEQFKNIEQRNDEINLLINQKKLEINSLKG